MVVHALDAEAQATLNGAADGKIAENVFAAQAEEAHRNLSPVADASFPVWSLPLAFSEALLVRIDAGPAIGGPFDVGIAHTGADRDTAALIAVDKPVQLDRCGDIVIGFGNGMD